MGSRSVQLLGANTLSCPQQWASDVGVFSRVCNSKLGLRRASCVPKQVDIVPATDEQGGWLTLRETYRAVIKGLFQSTKFKMLPVLLGPRILCSAMYFCGRLRLVRSSTI